MKSSAAALATASVGLTLLAFILAPQEGPFIAITAFSWAILAFYLAAIIQVGNKEKPAYLITWPLFYIPSALAHLLWRFGLRPPLYAVKWALGIRVRREAARPLDLPRTWAELQVSPQLKRHQQAPGFNLLLGLSARRLISAKLGESVHHLLITGVTGVGKSSVIRTILCALLLEGPGLFSRLTIHILDNKGGLGRPFLPVINAYPKGMISFQDEDAILADLESLKAQIVERQRVMDDALAETPEEAGLGRILVIIDDLQDIIADKDIEAMIASLSSKGRSAGVHLIISMPYSKANLLRSTISVNFHRISGYVRGGAERSIGIDGLSALGQHQFVFADNQRLEPILFSPYHITPQDVRKLSGAFVTSTLAPDEILVDLFVRQGGLGRRALAKQGLAQARALYPDALPFPFDEISIEADSNRVSMTKLARDYVTNVARLMIKFGLATPPEQAGESPKPVTRDSDLALSIWRTKYREELQNGRN